MIDISGVLLCVFYIANPTRWFFDRENKPFAVDKESIKLFFDATRFSSQQIKRQEK